MAIVSTPYRPPGVYTETNYDTPVEGFPESVRIPAFLGEGTELLTTVNLEVIRGSSSSQDQQVIGEDERGRAVVQEMLGGAIRLGDFDGKTTKFQVRNYPIVDGSGQGIASTNRSSVQVVVDGDSAVALSVDGQRGIVELVAAPDPTSVVLCSYFFHRKDTQFTEDLSFQVTPGAATVKANRGIADSDSEANLGETLEFRDQQLGPMGQVIVPANNVFDAVVDTVRLQFAIPPGRYTMKQAANAISAARAGSLRAQTFANNFGRSALQLVADSELQVLDGSANALLGLDSGQAAPRRRTFYTSHGPIVDGSDGGITTTDPTKVQVTVDGVKVVPTAVDGSSRGVTLPVAPKAGTRVVITYFANTWQDTFDYLAHRNVVQVLICGDVPDRGGYEQGADFILQDDKIVWGAAWTVDAAKIVAGRTPFDAAKVSGLLVDYRDYLPPCAPVVNVVGGQASESRTQFLLPHVPTLGNGRDTPIGQSLFQAAANNRIDVPSNRPDLIWAYWGYDPQDALLRGRAAVASVNGIQFELSSPIPVGARVYATHYYNTLTDASYQLVCTRSGAPGIGTYRVTDSAGHAIYTATYDTSSKGAALRGVQLEWPSGSELAPDVRLEGGTGSQFVGPVAETVTVQLESREATLARYVVPGPGPYSLISEWSNRARVRVNNAELSSGIAGLNLDNPANIASFLGGFFATLTGQEVDYTGGSGAVAGQSYTLDHSEEIVLDLDGVQVTAVAEPATGVTASHAVSAINMATAGFIGTAVNGSASTIVLPGVPGASLPNRFKGWTVLVGMGASAATAGQEREIISYDAATHTATVSAPWDGGAIVASDPFRLIDPTVAPQIFGETRFDAGITVAAGLFNQLSLAYVGDSTGLSGPVNITVSPGTYPTPADLAAEVGAQVEAAIAKLPAKFAGLRVACFADADGRLGFQLRVSPNDYSGYLGFLNAPGGPAADLAQLAGISTAPSLGMGQALLVEGPVATMKGIPGPLALRLHDHVILRNRIVPGSTSGSIDPAGSVEQSSLRVMTGSLATRIGFLPGDSGEAGSTATVRPASILGRVTFTTGQDTATGEPLVIFYDGSGSRPSNSELPLTVDGQPIVTRFASSSSGVPTPFGPISNPASILGQIVAAIVALPDAPFGSTPTSVIQSGIIAREGAGFRIRSQRADNRSAVAVGSASSAAAIFGLQAGMVAERELVSARRLASAFNAYRSNTLSGYLLNFAGTPVTGTFLALAVASIEVDATGSEYLALLSSPPTVSGYGTASSILLRDPLQGGIVQSSWLAYGTGIGAIDGDGDVGEPRVDGFVVTSDNPLGSGSANTSILNNGVGQDGLVGQTYRDLVTGLTFTLLPRGWQSNPTGPWPPYPNGSQATLRLVVGQEVTTDANLYRTTIPGLDMIVSNTLELAINDAAVLRTYNPGGREPAVGDIYYVSYKYKKPSFKPALYTRLSAVETAYGPTHPDNPVSLAAYLAFLNGAAIVAIKQVVRAPGSSQGSLLSYRDAIDEMATPLPGLALPDMIELLRGDSTELYLWLKRHCDEQSQRRMRQERTAICGLSAGTPPDAAKNLAQALASDRMRMVYPDVALLSLTDALGNTSKFPVDGTYIAAALSGSVASPVYDVATPWTGRRLVGFTSLGRRLTPIAMNDLASRGISIFEEEPSTLRCRHGLTTDTSDIAHSEPTVRLIADEVQRESRVVLDPYIGIKYLPGVAGQVEGRLSNYLKSKVRAAILTAYRGVKAIPSGVTSLAVSASYAPVFPLLYIDITYSLRSTLETGGAG